MNGTILGGVYTSGVTLSNPTTENPATVTGTISVASGTALLGLSGTAWMVTDQGRIASGTGNGISLASGGSIDVAAGALITAGASGAYIYGAPGSVTNAGTIDGTTVVGVALRAGGSVANVASGFVYGAYAGVYISGGTGSVTNAGRIGAAAGYAYSDGVALLTGGMVSNALSGTIASYRKGIAIYGSSGTVLNAGAIAGTAFIGVALQSGGIVSNAASGTITGGYSGVYGGGTAATVTNYGSIGAGHGFSISSGVALFNGGEVSNLGSGVITGVYKGVAIYNGAGTVVNAATIAATGSSGNAVSLSSGFGNLLVDEPGAIFVGAVNGGNTIGNTSVSTLELASSSLQGTIGGLGTQFTEFAQMVLDEGANWVISGANSLAAGVTLSDNGSLLVNDGTLTGAGSVVIAEYPGIFAGATVVGTAAVWSTARIVVGDSGVGSLAIESNGKATTTIDAVIANQSGAAGSSVNVVAGDWQVGGTLDIGNNASGALAVAAGGTVGVAALDAGIQNSGTSDGVGQISVSGTSSALNVSGNAIVGDAGTALMSIVNGATFTATDLTIGAQATGSGAVFLSDAGSRIDLSGTLSVGTSLGIGELTLGPFGTVVASRVVLNGDVVNQGGLLDPNEVDVTSGHSFKGFGGLGSAGDLIMNLGTLEGTGLQQLLTVMGTLSGTGAVLIDNDSTLEFGGGPVSTTQSVSFGGPIGGLIIDDIGAFGATITAINVGDTIVVNTAVPVTFSQSGSLVSVLEGSTTVGVLAFASPTLATIGLGALVDQVAPCFVAGTRIATVRGEVRVEDLLVGEQVHVLGGPAKPIVWIGHRVVNCIAHPDRRKVWPVRITAEAFGPGRPCRDLWLSPDHALYVAGVLIPVKCLINGTTIEQLPVESVTYYHLELLQHAVVLAEGLPAESYLDTGDRGNFANGGGPVTLHPDFSSRVWDAAGCAPVVVDGPQLEAARRQIAAAAVDAPAPEGYIARPIAAPPLPRWRNW